MMGEISGDEGVEVGKGCGMFDWVDIMNVFVYDVYLFEELLVGVVDRVMVEVDLVGEKVLEGGVVLDIVVNERYGVLGVDL